MSPAPPTRSLQPIRVVVADDELYAETIGYFLGYEDEIEVVGYAQDAQDALALVALHRPEILVINAELARGDAFRAIETIPELASTGIVLLSDPYDERLEKAREAGATCVAKPSVADELIPTIVRSSPAAHAASAGATA